MYLLQVEKSDIDKVVLELMKFNITIVDVFRSSGSIQVKTENKERLDKIKLVKSIKKEGIIPQLLQL